MMNTLYANSYSGFPISGFSFGLFTIGAIFLFILALAIVALKGYALWNAARRDEKGWFVALLLINTLGVLELVYLYFIVGKWKNGNKTEIKTEVATPIVENPSTSTTPSAQ